MARALAACVRPRARRPGRLFGGGYSIRERLNALAMIRLLQRPVDVLPLVEAIYDLHRPEIWGHAAATMGEVGLWLDWSSPQMAHLTHAFQIMLRHPDASVRCSAARYLGELSSYEAIEALQKRLRVEEAREVRTAIVLALSQLDEARGVLTLLDAQDRGEVSHDDCLAALARVGRRAVEPLLGVLRRRDVRLNSRVIAAEALGIIGDPRAVEPLIEIVERQHESVNVMRAAAQSLGRIGDVRALEPLVSIAENSEWWPPGRGFLVEAALEALLRFTIPEAIPELLRVLRGLDAESAVHYRVLRQALTLLGIPLCEEQLPLATWFPAPPQRPVLLDGTGIAALRRIVLSPGQAVELRAAAAELLGYFPEFAPLGFLLQTMRLPPLPVPVRSGAVRGLEALADPAARPTLEAVRDDESEPIALREEAGQVLDRRGWSCPEPPPWLESLCDDYDSAPF